MISRKPSVISKSRRLPSPGRILFEPGSKVTHDTVVGELDYVPGSLVRVDVAKQLGVAGEQLGEILVKKVDDKVETGEIIAASAPFFSRRVARCPTNGYLALWSRYLGYVYIREPIPIGPKDPVTYTAEDLGLSRMQFAANIVAKPGAVAVAGQLLISGSKKVVAPAICRVSEISLSEGYLVISPLYQITELTAFMDGTVSEIPDADTCVISCTGYRFSGAVGYGTEAGGIIKPLMSEDRDLDVGDLTESLNGAIVVARRGISLAALHHLADEGVSGLVLGCIDPGVLKAFSRRDPLKDLGALMEIRFPIILIQGFGAAMLRTVYDEIASLSGRRGAMDASTQLRAGVKRPDLLVPLPELDLDLYTDEEKITEGHLAIGAQVVLCREPFFGSTGIVEGMETQLGDTPAGTKATLITVRLDNGEAVRIPLSNCRVF